MSKSTKNKLILEFNLDKNINIPVNSFNEQYTLINQWYKEKSEDCELKQKYQKIENYTFRKLIDEWNIYDIEENKITYYNSWEKISITVKYHTIKFYKKLLDERYLSPADDIKSYMKKLLNLSNFIESLN